MLYLPLVVFVNGLHNQFDEQRRFTAQFFQIDLHGVVWTVYRFPVMNKIGHLYTQLNRLVGIFYIKGVVRPILCNNRQITLTRKIP